MKRIFMTVAFVGACAFAMSAQTASTATNDAPAKVCTKGDACCKKGQAGACCSKSSGTAMVMSKSKQTPQKAQAMSVNNKKEDKRRLDN